ncbi:alpha/beta hydrolase [Virgibacillus sp. LDC-1]|uniref:alpha/beta fold hydrolase n=1 Tax=Virgibacillus sp. LDC-1 TaxID=3039856 RepID=UPI0024DE94ED|nr:alpha/beta hydrolase [Virgibacillus sp. LDC-1]
MFIEINGCKLYYEVHGQSDEKDTIFFIHGGPGLGDCRGDVTTFKHLESMYQLVFLDMRGSGRSADVPPYTHEQWVKDIDGLRDRLSIDSIILHGSSYGGFIVQEYVLKYPERTKAIILNVTAPDNQHHFEAIDNALKSEKSTICKEDLKRLFAGKVQSNHDFRTLYGAILPLYTMKNDIEAQQEKLNQIYFHYQTHNDAFHKNLETFDLKDKLNEIRVPTLVVAGKKDWIVPSKYARSIANLIHHSTYVEFENYGHSLVREVPDVYSDLLQKFLMGNLTGNLVVDIN